MAIRVLHQYTWYSRGARGQVCMWRLCCREQSPQGLTAPQGCNRRCWIAGSKASTAGLWHGETWQAGIASLVYWKAICARYLRLTVLTQVWGSAGSNATRTGRMNWKTEPPPKHSTPVPHHPFLYLLLIPSFQKQGRNQQTNFCPLGKKKN